MKILALETSGKVASVAIVENDSVLAEYSSSTAKKHAETLMPMIESVVAVVGGSVEDLDFIACTSGPGSFTGLRIAATTAKGLAFAANKPLVAVPTLDAMAFSSELADLANFIALVNMQNVLANLWLVPMIDARREQAYSAFYCNGNRIGEYMAEPVVDIVNALKTKISANDKVVFLADSANIANMLGGLENTGVLPKSLVVMAKISAASVARCAKYIVAANAANIDQYHESNFSLMYIRKPQAEREKAEREQNIP
ncbi:MAG: tRNA (adenosine(37)-N6)-threonylcarbamoyltransferase complex dimerization subunit type 1 TsaB [Defluviitaleaceae bacterium]|nr:tRNA (adenosine(37)-N6)-threonylcarbamoyltransferase complex dimerization subunit type 1 TsaB [Defluviitaleaceae bacterium]